MTFIEKLARVACCPSGFCHNSEMREAVCCQAHTFIPEVRAILQAMREPSEEMLLARPGEGFDGPSVLEAKAVWQSMIDAALAEKP